VDQIFLNLGQGQQPVTFHRGPGAVAYFCVLAGDGLQAHLSIVATSVNQLRIRGPKAKGEDCF